MTLQPYPPFFQTNTKLIHKVREIRKESIRQIQQVTLAEYKRLATNFLHEGETLITTVEGLTTGKSAATRDQRLEQIATVVGQVRAQLDTKLVKRRNFLAARQPTGLDWDKFFDYVTAYRRNKSHAEFEVLPSDKAQTEEDIAEDTARAVQRALEEDDEEGEIHLHPHQPIKKRKRDPSPPYKIPKRTDNQRRDPQPQQQRGRKSTRGGKPHGRNNNNNPRSSTSTSPYRNQDFGQSRPPHTHRDTYHRNPSSARGSAAHTSQGNGGDRRRAPRPHQQRSQAPPQAMEEIEDLQRQLDRLRRQQNQ